MIFFFRRPLRDSAAVRRRVAAALAAVFLAPFPLRLASPSELVEPVEPQVSVPTPAQLRNMPYEETLRLAVLLMDQGRHSQAIAPLRAALLQDRNELLGLIALGTLYLHTGSGTRALAEFQRARTLAPADPLPAWGIALSQTLLGKLDAASAAADVVPDATIPSAALLRDYLSLLRGSAAGIGTGVTGADPDMLQVELAGFAALKAGDAERGESLLRSLTQRPAFRKLAEDRALSLTFEPTLPAQGGAPTLPTAIEFPKPPVNAAALSGRVTLSPPANIPVERIGFVSYSIEGSLSATTNYPPFTTDWNTERVPNGLYTLRTTVYSTLRNSLSETTRTLVVQNKDGARSSGRLTPEQDQEIRTRLLKLLTPRASRKAAHFTLAECAAQRGDTEGAVTHIESVVAIDPMFNNARQSLHRYNREVAGPCEGVWKCETQEKLVALTFDDGPNPSPNRTPALLDALRKVNAPSTFFVVGVRAEQSPDLLRQMVEDGHEVANHSFTHPNLTYLSAPAVERELCRTSVVIRQATGRRPRFYRPPGGNFNGATVSAARALGMAGAYWTLDGLPYENPPIPPARLTRYVLDNVRPGAIVLLHNAPDNTVAAIPEIVRGLRARGYEIVTMSDLVRRARPIVKGASLTRTRRSSFYGGE